MKAAIMDENQEFICEFCKKSFIREGSLVNHSCEQKRRWLEKDTKWSLIGLLAYQRFYQLTKAAGSKVHNKEDFLQSKFYNDFVKLGRFISNTNVVNPQGYIDYLILNEIKLSKWIDELVYESYIKDLISKEGPQSGIEKSITYIAAWSKETENDMQLFYELINTNVVVNAIRSGRLSPWLIYLAPNSEVLLNRLDDSQLKLLEDILKPAVWQIRKSRFKKECEQLGNLLRSYGL